MESESAKRLEEYSNNLDKTTVRKKKNKILLNSRSIDDTMIGSKDLAKSRSESAVNIQSIKRFQRELQVQKLAKDLMKKNEHPKMVWPKGSAKPRGSNSNLSRTSSFNVYTPIFRSSSNLTLPGTGRTYFLTRQPSKSANDKVSKYRMDQKIMNEALLIQNLSNRALHAARSNKVFVIVDELPVLREALISRGWVQKLTAEQLNHRVRHPHYNELRHVSYILKNFRPNFVWAYTSYNKYEFNNHPIYSRLSCKSNESDFTLKSGLSNLYNNMQWFYASEEATFIYPRCYVMNNKYEIMSFVRDFRLTYCTGFLYELANLQNLEELFTPYGNVTSECINFALEQVRAAINQKNHYDVDNQVEYCINMQHYVRFNKIFQGILKEGFKVRIIDNYTAEELTEVIQRIVQEALVCFPHIKLDGHHNSWIVKPSAAMCGSGIRVFNNEKDILNYITGSPAVHYVVQKYIERPLLVYKTKFDIRQHFLVTMDGKYFNIWMYKNCYCRFSSQEFSMDDLQESIHLTNHAIQKNYKNGSRSEQLPSHNMWIKNDLLKYFESIDKSHIWADNIYPRMTEALITVVTAAIDDIEYTTNNFQLFGADFMITEDFHPILIEINSAPSLLHSTVSSKIVNTAVLQDLVKVVIDRMENPSAATGDFEVIWKVEMPKLVQNCELLVQGQGFRSNVHHKRRILEENQKGPVVANNYLIQDIRSRREIDERPKATASRRKVSNRKMVTKVTGSNSNNSNKSSATRLSPSSVMATDSFLAYMHEKNKLAQLNVPVRHKSSIIASVFGKRNRYSNQSTTSTISNASGTKKSVVVTNINMPTHSPEILNTISTKNSQHLGKVSPPIRPVSSNNYKNNNFSKKSNTSLSKSSRLSAHMSYINRHTLLNKITNDEIKATNEKLSIIKKRIEQYTSDLNTNALNFAKRKEKILKKVTTKSDSMTKFQDLYKKKCFLKEKLQKMK